MMLFLVIKFETILIILCFYNIDLISLSYDYKMKFIN